MPSLSQRVRDIIGDSLGASIVEQNIEKAIQAVKERAAAPEAVFYDPMTLFMGREWLVRGGAGLGFDDLRAMARNPIIGSIIQTRITQIAAYMRPQKSAYDVGYQITSVDVEKTNTAKASEISKWLFSSGMEGYGEPLLETLARKFFRDSLELDQATIEIVMRRNLTPAYMVAVDAGTIRRLKESLNHALPAKKGDIHYVQIMQDRIVAKFTDEQLIFGIRNPTTNVKTMGYGMSELEILIRTVTTILNTERFNAGQLTAGGTSKGMLIVKGTTDQEQMNAFKRDFREAIRNAASYWRPPVLQVSADADVKWETLDRSNRDMEYAQLFDFLVKQACGVYQIDPAEINWQIGAAGSKTTFESGQGQKVKFSKEKGLKPLLNFFANHLNGEVINLIDPGYRVDFVGMDQDRKTDSEIRDREVRAWRTVNEVRAELGDEEIEGGDIILDDIFAKARGIGVEEGSGNSLVSAEQE